MLTVHALKPAFQRVLRPSVNFLASAGVTANQVTCAACAVSVATGTWLALAGYARYFYALPLIILLRMALNAADGMLAREHGQATVLGAYLNEICDVISDAFLILPFAFLPSFSSFWVGVTIQMIALCEMTGVLAASTGASRRYDGPMGKSDRALVFAAAGIAVASGLAFPPQAGSILCQTVSFLIGITIFNRVRGGIGELNA